MTRDAVALVLTLALAACASDAPPRAERDPCAALGEHGSVLVESGRARGSAEDGTCAFLGIPYAAPPVGNLRFRPPEQPASWPGIREANAFGPACPQLEARFDVQSEDCLYLNVWSPPSAQTELRPLLVVVHGGGNVSGSAADPELHGAWLARQTGAVVVTFDYRLGALGYLSHASLSAEDAHSSSGNYGMLDQIAALEWLQRNAAAFGGDPARVVGIGQSAGSRNLCVIVGSPLASGLLSGVILQSGACNVRDLAQKYLYGRDVALELGCSTAADVPACLRRATPDRLTSVLPSLPNPMTISQYNPAIDGWSIVDDPLARLRSGAHGIPVIVGSNADEVGHVMPWITREEQYVTLVEALFGSELAPVVLSTYPASNHPSPRDALVTAVTEARYTCPSLETANAAAQSGPAYLYVFSHALAAGPEAAFGAYHGLELVFLFASFSAHGYDPTDEERTLAIDLASYYQRFAESGSPQPDAAGAAPHWPDYSPFAQPFLRFDTPLVTGAQPAARRCEIWQSIE